MVVSANRNGSGSRKKGIAFSSERIPQGLLNRRDCRRNRVASKYSFKIFVRIGKGRKSKDFTKCRKSQNVPCYGEAAMIFRR